MVLPWQLKKTSPTPHAASSFLARNTEMELRTPIRVFNIGTIKQTNAESHLKKNGRFQPQMEQEQLPSIPTLNSSPTASVIQFLH
jgi:hypothetical protein